MLVSANVDLKDWIVEASAGYRFHPSAFLILGVRYYKVDGTITPDGPLGLLPTTDADEGWLDPIVGIGWRPQLSKRVTLNFRGDVGGFGLASDLVWHGMASIDLRISRLVSLGAGYRILDYDYGKEREQFAFKVEHSGPLALPALLLVSGEPQGPSMNRPRLKVTMTDPGDGTKPGSFAFSILGTKTCQVED